VAGRERSGSTRPEGFADHYTTPRELGPARVDLTKALGLAGELEDAALTR
jgi:hypothetical protein